ncbi:MAG: LOG family protein [Anaerolineales bacterium]
MKIITVFGGSLPLPGSPAYQEAYQLGQQLASAGYAVQTGGYIGTMEAVSHGASDAGGYVIGVTCDEIESWRPVAPNQWVKEEKRRPTLRERLFVLIDECDGAIALPGGIGTLAEIALTWAQLQIQPSDRRPLILLGDGWKETIETFQHTLGDYIKEADRQRILLEPTVQDAVARLKKSLE